MSDQTENVRCPTVISGSDIAWGEAECYIRLETMPECYISRNAQAYTAL